MAETDGVRSAGQDEGAAPLRLPAAPELSAAEAVVPPPRGKVRRWPGRAPGPAGFGLTGLSAPVPLSSSLRLITACEVTLCFVRLWLVFVGCFLVFTPCVG